MKRFISWLLILSFLLPAGAFADPKDEKKKSEKDDTPKPVVTSPTVTSNGNAHGELPTMTSNGNVRVLVGGSRETRSPIAQSPDRFEKMLIVYYSHFAPPSKERQEAEYAKAMAFAKEDAVIGGRSEASFEDQLFEQEIMKNSCLKTDYAPADQENEAMGVARFIAMLDNEQYNDVVGHIGAEYLSTASHRPAIDLLMTKLHEIVAPELESYKKMTAQKDIGDGILTVWGLMFAFRYGPVGGKALKNMWSSRMKGLGNLFRFRKAAQAVTELAIEEAEAAKVLPTPAGMTAAEGAQAAAAADPLVKEAEQAAFAQGMTREEIAATTSRARRVARWAKEKGLISLKWSRSFAWNRTKETLYGLPVGLAWHWYLHRHQPKIDPAALILERQKDAIVKAETTTAELRANIEGFRPESGGEDAAKARANFLAGLPKAMTNIQLLKEEVAYLSSVCHEFETRSVWITRDLNLSSDELPKMAVRVRKMDLAPAAPAAPAVVTPPAAPATVAPAQPPVNTTGKIVDDDEFATPEYKTTPKPDENPANPAQQAEQNLISPPKP